MRNIFKRKNKDGEKERQIYVNCGDVSEAKKLHKKFPDNRVVTSKYTLWSFLPVNLFDQLRRVANLYYIGLVIVMASIDAPVSFTTVLWPLVLVVAVTAIKQGYEDIKRHQSDRAVNDGKVTILRAGKEKVVKSREIRVGEIVRVENDQPIPCDLVLLTTSNPTGVCYVTTANLDGETSLKTLRCPRVLRDYPVNGLNHFRANIICDPPSVDLYTYHGRLEILPEGPGPLQASTEAEALDIVNLGLRGATLRNTDYVYGCAVFTGQETKLTLNTLMQRNKFSTGERSVNKLLLFCLPYLLALIALSVGLKYGLESTTWFSKFIYFPPKPEVTVGMVIQTCMAFWVLYYYIIPIALYVSVELQKFVGAKFFGNDIEMYCEELDEVSIANTSDLNEELGQVEYLFADKTGTLTENDMVFRRCSINGSCYEEKNGHLIHLEPSGRDITPTTLTEEAEAFFLTMALCHTVQVSESGGKLEYQSSNPDEKSLVEAASRCGVVFLSEVSDNMKIRVGNNKTLIFKRLETIEFTSERRCMSVVVEDPEGRVWVVVKGAESSVVQMCTTGPKVEVLHNVSDFAERGLRTMVVARRMLTKEVWLDLRAKLQHAQQLVSNERGAELAAASAAIENGLTLLGATGVEDRLQTGVTETLVSLRAAGLKVWVLTGDKIETAMNISVSCGHFKTTSIQIALTGHTDPEEALTALQALKNRVDSEPFGQFELVIDGGSLAFVLKCGKEILRELCTNCVAVLACRLSPLQKCELVQLVKSTPGRPITAAVGDGANDVSMIQEAHVGIGIVGKEGRQAVHSSDYAVPRFRYLKRAFFVHGHWYYVRVAVLIQYFFYKMFAFVLPMFLYSITTIFSTQVHYTPIYMIGYNLLFTSFPILAYGILEQDLPADYLMNNPREYAKLRQNSMCNWGTFTLWFLSGIWHGVCLYYGPLIMISINSCSILYNNTDAGAMIFGTIVAHCMVMVTNLKIWIVARYWNVWFIGILAVSMFGLYLGLMALHSALFKNTGEIYYAYIMLLSSPGFWLLSLIICSAALIPDFTLEAWKQMAPSSLKKMPWQKKSKKHMNVLTVTAPHKEATKISSVTAPLFSHN